MPKRGQRKVADVIRVDGTVERLPTTVAKMPSEKSEAIVGGWVERLDINNRHCIEMWINQHGRGGTLELPINPKATQLCAVVDADAFAVVGEVIHGDVIVERWEGEQHVHDILQFG